MRYKAYRKLYRISVEEKKGDSSQKVIIQNILIVLFWSLIFFVCFVTFQMDPNKFSFYYCLLYLILELLLLFSVIHLYESSQFIINFLRNVPITENKIFYFHYIASGWSLNYVTELITIVVYLALFKAKWINIVLLLIGIATIKLLRTYLEFLLVLLKNHQKRFPIWTIAFFFLTLCLYTIVPKGYFSNFQWTFSFFIFILSVTSFFAIVTYRIIIKALLKGNFSLENFVWFNKFTNSLSEFATTIFRFNRVFQKLVKVQLIRMIRSPEYVQKLLTIGIMYFIFSLVSDLVIDKAMGESPNESLSNLLYTAFLISFLSFSNITLDYKLIYRYQLEHLPVSLRSVKASIDIAHGILLYTLLTFIFLVQIVIGKVNYSLIIDGYVVFTCFYFLGIGIEPSKINFDSYAEKAPSYFKFIFLSVIVETLFYLHVIWPVKLVILCLCFIFMYYRAYQKKEKYTTIPSIGIYFLSKAKNFIKHLHQKNRENVK